MRLSRQASIFGIFLLTGCGLLLVGLGAPELPLAGPIFKGDKASNSERTFLTFTR